ncbi:hypothetical protein SAMN04487948_11051 [Halogranum amylolyticum]|uniref:Uncharacterized protein n=1 Tax=Halogranum amylolyticum TaxID=660520 RepID=A0A1H8UB69_9EURY|nr:hypothetical protein SAMN04487948_11051 [Halogranum amylolyticum]
MDKETNVRAKDLSIQSDIDFNTELGTFVPAKSRFEHGLISTPLAVPVSKHVAESAVRRVDASDSEDDATDTIGATDERSATAR